MPAGRRPMQRRKERKQAKKWKEGSKKGRNKEKVKERRKRTWWFVGFPRRMRRQIVKQLKADPSTLSRSRLEFPSESNPHNDGLKLSATFSFGREKAATRLKPTKKKREKERGTGWAKKARQKTKIHFIDCTNSFNCQTNWQIWRHKSHSQGQQSERERGRQMPVASERENRWPGFGEFRRVSL